MYSAGRAWVVAGEGGQGGGVEMGGGKRQGVEAGEGGRVGVEVGEGGRLWMEAGGLLRCGVRERLEPDREKVLN